MSLPEKLLWGAATVCLVVTLICLVALLVEAPPLLGMHPAMKPLKFAISIGLFLATMAILVPQLETSRFVRLALALVLVSTNAVELGLIALQAARGRTSHFNAGTPLDASIFAAMAIAIVVMVGAVVVISCLATFRDLGDDAATALAWRVALWMFLLVAITGFTMVSHGQHTVGASDGGAGLPVVNWSRAHGDLRIAHFIALHALQTLPVFAVACRWLPVEATTRVVVVAIACIGYAGVSVAAFVAALNGRSLV